MTSPSYQPIARIGIACITVAALVPLCQSPGAVDAATRNRRVARPNILIIVTDDQRAGTLRSMPKTRRWFKRGGKNYTQAYATTPLCCPSRASILTGRYAHNHRVKRNVMGHRLNHATTIERRLDAAGYTTAIAGKFLNAWKPEKDPPHFDRWAVFNPYLDPGYYHTRFNVNGVMRRVNRYSTDFIARRATRWLRRFESHDSSPWFMYLAPYGPHDPYVPAHRHMHSSVPQWRANAGIREGGREDKPAWVRARNETWERARHVATRQHRTLKSVDDLVGLVLRRMGRLNERKRTLAFFLSDNGYLWGEHGLMGKRAPYTPSVRIPLLARWPGHIGRGTRSHALAANIDIAPTILDAARLTPGAMKVDGRSLFSSRRRTHLLLEFFHELRVPSWSSIRTPRAQYIEYYGRHGRVTFRELYNTERDPWQLHNRWRQRREFKAGRASRLRAVLSAARHCSGSRCP